MSSLVRLLVMKPSLLRIVSRSSAEQQSCSNSASKGSQDPTLQADTVQSNILYGSDTDGKKYQAVLNACLLNQDIESWDCGDSQPALSCSGGQKQRIVSSSKHAVA